MFQSLEQLVTSQLTKESTSLSVENCGVVDKDLSTIISLLNNAPKIVTLSLAQNNISSQGLPTLAQLKYITHLNLSCNGIGDDHLAVLVNNEVLRELELKHNAVKQQGFETLLASKFLTFVDVEGTFLTEAQITQLAEKMQQNKAVLAVKKMVKV